MGGACGTHGENKLIRLLVGKSEGKTTLGRHDVGGKILLKFVLNVVRA